MGILDDLKQNAEKLGDKVMSGLDAAQDKAVGLVHDAGDVLGDAKDRAADLIGEVKDDVTGHDSTAPVSESSDIAPDAPAAADPDASDLDVAEPVGGSDVVSPGTADQDPVVVDAAETATDVEAEPAVESDVDPFDEPLSETIGDEIASDAVDEEAVAEAVGSTDEDGRA